MRRRSFLIGAVAAGTGIAAGSALFFRQDKFGSLPKGDRLKRILASPNYRDGAFREAMSRLFLVSCLWVCLVRAEGVKLSSFGFNPEDSTEIIQQAIDSGARKLVFDRQSGPWIVRPLVGRSNLELVFEDGVELVAKRGEFHGIRDYLFRFECVSNVVIRGLGETGGTFRMWKRDYQDSKSYAKSEWRYALRLSGVENVLVENMSFRSSGGDGIVIGMNKTVNSRNVTIRRCVCDDNHRQGISLCSGENILIEDTVLSNTRGTPPEAGIDFEPDRPNETIANVTLRNVVSTNNAGNGFEIYLRQLRDFSKPVSLRLVDCTSFGNRTSVSVCGDNFNESGVVKGLVSFDGCRFVDPQKTAIHITGTPASALDVSFRNCAIRNARTDVLVDAGNARQGNPDGLTFDNLTIHQTDAHPWFSFGRRSYGPSPSHVRGTVAVWGAEGLRERVVLDAAWAERNMPMVNGGEMPAPRVRLPQEVKVIDARPGGLVDLSPVALVYGGHYVIAATKAGDVKLVARQLDVTGKRPATTKKTSVRQILPSGKMGRMWRIPTAGFKSEEIVFQVPEPGFYSVEMPNEGTRFILERASVPVGIDVREKEHIVAGIRGKPFSLWFFVPKGDRATFCTAGDSYYRFAMKVFDSAGRQIFGRDVVEDLASVSILGENETGGLYRTDFAPSAQRTYDWIRTDLSGVPGILFLAPDRYWR